MVVLSGQAIPDSFMRSRKLGVASRSNGAAAMKIVLNEASWQSMQRTIYRQCSMLLASGTHKFEERAHTMSKILSSIVIALLSFSAMAEHHNSIEAEVNDAAEAFNTAYATNDVKAYFGFYTEDAVLYFYGARQKVSEYRESWTASIEAGGGVEINEMSDQHIQLMPSGDVAVVTGFIDNRTRGEDGATTTVRAFETDVWQKIGGEWKIVGLHYSEIPAEE